MPGPEATSGAIGAGPVPGAAVLEIASASAAETLAIGAALAPALERGDLVLLVGDIGAGKTTFAQGVAAGLGVREPVTSPTFTLVRPYVCAPAEAGAECSSSRPRSMLHADLYRLERLHDVADLALDELLEEDAVALVEWGDAGWPALGSAAVVVQVFAAEEDAAARRLRVELPARRVARLGSLLRRAAVLREGR